MFPCFRSLATLFRNFSSRPYSIFQHCPLQSRYFIPLFQILVHPFPNIINYSINFFVHPRFSLVSTLSNCSPLLFYFVSLCVSIHPPPYPLSLLLYRHVHSTDLRSCTSLTCELHGRYVQAGRGQEVAGCCNLTSLAPLIPL